MKSSILSLLTILLAGSASAAPLSPGMSSAIGGGVAAAHQLQTATALTPNLTILPLRPTLVVPAAPVPVQPVRAR